MRMFLLGGLALMACGDGPSDGSEVDTTALSDSGGQDGSGIDVAPDVEVVPEVVTPTVARCDEAHAYQQLALDESVSGVVLTSTPEVPYLPYAGVLFEVAVPPGTAAWAVVDWPAYLDQRCVSGCRTYELGLLDEACEPLLVEPANYGGSAGEEAPGDDRGVGWMRIDGSDAARTVEVIATGPHEPGGLPYRAQLLPMRCYMDWPMLAGHDTGVLTVDDRPALVTMDPPGRVEAFHVELAAGETARFEISSDELSAFSTIGLYDPECRKYVAAEDGAIAISAPTSGTYTLELVAFPFSMDADGLAFAIDRVE